MMSVKATTRELLSLPRAYLGCSHQHELAALGSKALALDEGLGEATADNADGEDRAGLAAGTLRGRDRDKT